ncbi:hypothetical protein ACFQ46_17850 [Kineococcus sp. GCM10028916]|uniref:hypothetical protein n=1 Tax=Kineococcus sp. GCM10028916 TaxID=3273394 RepID=UPI003642CADE
MNPLDLGGIWRDEEPGPRRVDLGRWSLELRRGGSLSNLTFSGVAVLRAVRGVLRDRDWRTAPATVLDVTTRDGGLRVHGTFHDEGGEDVVDATWEIGARADPGRLVVEFTATTRRAFQRNRFGLVVLHRPDDAGTPLRVRHPDGAWTATQFPVAIAPHQPARDVAELRWSRPGVDVAVEFRGDVFEMEDQRNWSDASFKTYSTPLSEPFPVRLEPGTVVHQQVVVRCAPNALPVPVPARPTRVDLVVTDEPSPQWGSTSDVEGFAGPLLVELVTADPEWLEVLERARRCGRPLDVRIVTDDPAEVGTVVDATQGVEVLRFGVHSRTTHVSTPELWAALRTACAGLPGDLVAGARSHFTELNRTVEFLPADATGVVFASTPQMHDTGRDQVFEALAVQELTARQAVAIGGGRPVHVGPVTLRPRFNAVATTPWRVDRDRVPRDPRRDGRGFAAWVIASAAAFAVPGVASVSFGDVDGSAAAGLRLLAGLDGSRRLRLAPGCVLAQGVHLIGGRGAGGDAVLVANLADDVRVVDLAGADLTLEPGEVRRHAG